MLFVPPRLTIEVFSCAPTLHKSMANGNYTFTLVQGETFNRVITYTDPSNTPIDLSGFSGAMEVRSPIDDSVLTEFSTTLGNMTLGGIAGTITLSANSSVTANLPAVVGNYDLFLTSPSMVASCLLSGAFEIQEAITT